MQPRVHSTAFHVLCFVLVYNEAIEKEGCGRRGSGKGRFHGWNQSLSHNELFMWKSEAFNKERMNKNHFSCFLDHRDLLRDSFSGRGETWSRKKHVIWPCMTWAVRFLYPSPLLVIKERVLNKFLYCLRIFLYPRPTVAMLSVPRVFCCLVFMSPCLSVLLCLCLSGFVSVFLCLCSPVTCSCHPVLLRSRATLVSQAPLQFCWGLAFVLSVWLRSLSTLLTEKGVLVIEN